MKSHFASEQTVRRLLDHQTPGTVDQLECFRSVTVGSLFKSREADEKQESLMKATKVLKRLGKIEASLSDLIERISTTDRRGHEFLQSAKAYVIRAKGNLQASSRTAKNPHVKHGDQPPSKATAEPSKPKRKLSAAGRKAIVAATKKRWALKRAEAAKAKPPVARKSAPAKKAGTKKATVKTAVTKKKKTAPVAVQTAEGADR
jgi:hypothetical protein